MKKKIELYRTKTRHGLNIIKKRKGKIYNTISKKVVKLKIKCTDYSVKFKA